MSYSYRYANTYAQSKAKLKVEVLMIFDNKSVIFLLTLLLIEH